MRTGLAVLRIALTVILALAFGFIGFALLFSDLQRGETALGRYATSFGLNLVLGFLIGLVNPRQWMLALVLAWGGVLITGRQIILGPSHWVEALLTTAISILPALAGGWLGGWVRRRRAPG